jgi:hypothetical protein
MYPEGLDINSFNFLMALAGLISGGLLWYAILAAFLN